MARKNRGFQHPLGEEDTGEILLRSHDPAVPSPGPSPTASLAFARISRANDDRSFDRRAEGRHGNVLRRRLRRVQGRLGIRYRRLHQARRSLLACARFGTDLGRVTCDKTRKINWRSKRAHRHPTQTMGFAPRARAQENRLRPLESPTPRVRCPAQCSTRLSRRARR
jgi:hypothetical protein